MAWYTQHVVDAGRAPTLVALLAFVVTFVVVRGITRRIRSRSQEDAERGPDPAGGAAPRRRRLVGDVTIGGVHVHHQVWGILLVLTTGLLLLRYAPGPPASWLLGLFFGVGAALALDEFALWLYVDDVYWSPQGEKSVEAVLVGAAVGAALLVATSPVGETPDEVEGGLRAYAASVVVHLVCAVVCFLKGKVATGMVGIVVPVVAAVGAVRLAKPSSWWARRRYAARPRRRARAQERFGARYHARQQRVRAFLGGAPSAPAEATGRPTGPDLPT
ncbi:hypothetical protein [Puerhibacterium sp. TATVAM-FAB25]|uniref:hypothetical protein n=1 Tax=Puerhibacterium sp. TATVAM-FAB25 TaxID=3093699 RepID=UPI00397D43C9